MLATESHAQTYDLDGQPTTADSWIAPVTLISEIPGTTSKSLAAREHAYLEGDAKTQIYAIESGAVCIYKVLADGRRQVIDFALPGDIIGLGTTGEHAYSAQATTATCLRCLPYASLHTAARSNPAFGMLLYDCLSHELDAARDLLVTVGQRNAMQRVTSFLLSLSARNVRYGEDREVVVLPMTRSDIADFLGLTIETVSRTITKLKTRGYIKLEEAGRIRLLDLDAMHDLCSDD